MCTDKKLLFKPNKHDRSFVNGNDEAFIDIARTCISNKKVQRIIKKEENTRIKATQPKVYESEEFKERMSKKTKENFIRNPELKQIIINSNKNRWSNPEFKERLEAGIHKMVESRCIPIVCKGIEYPNIKEACNATGYNFRTLKKYCDDPFMKDWYYVDK